MSEIKNILVPIDFSEVSEFVAVWAKEFAQKLGAKIHLVFVLEDLTEYEGFYIRAEALTELENLLLEGAQKSMDDFVKKHFSDVPEVNQVIVKGDVVEKILETGQRVNADLIIIGTHGRKGLDRILFGSVADGVVKQSSIPVITINPYRIKKT